MSVSRRSDRTKQVVERVAAGAYPTLTFRMPPELRERLQAAAGDRPIGEEIRQRLEASFGPAPAVEDAKTGQLLAGIAAMAEFFAAVPRPVSDLIGVTSSLGPWHDDPIAFAALQSAVLMLLRLLGPSGEAQEIDEAVRNPLSAMALNAGLSKAGIGDRMHVGEGRKERRR